ncbi:membrane protein [Aquipluma nitroreducens]|uniref:Membrane protein n=1 Tax=Aquipluma nitroreducens TaxID=2010828 RepID=A0A5K7SD59_9BACT|nr:DUF2723 domain-containing protein [Aquipluma nitroreducens]BBE19194.1 membrane protein [Aquipluma nitroreducens]
MNQQKINNLTGWGVFVVSLIIYVLTLEPTLSLWDCGEFLTSAYKLEINHSPGAPLFMLLGRIFSLFSFGNPTHAAYAINLVSAVASAATILFLFWTIVWLVSKLEQKQGRQFPLFLKFGAAAIGALSFAFTDSFWFSAVEAEVYALSSLFSAVVLWAATRWEREADQPDSSRWIVLIFFLIGLSIGVHLLNLLVIPSVGLIIYFRKYNYSLKGLIAAILISGIGIVSLLQIFIPGILDLSKNLELFFVNSLHFPIHSGLITYVILLIALLSGGIIYSHRKQLPKLNLALLCLTFLLVGYTSYVATIVRASANVPVNQGDPETTFSLLNYLNREQYGTRPILYGENFASVVTGYKERETWIAKDGKYIKSKLNAKIEYDPRTIGFFPRMHSNDPEHIDAYKKQFNFKGRRVMTTDEDGKQTEIIVPTFHENLSFFLNYQLGFMYIRYFMWNFAGRQNDIQGTGGLLNGNWQSGIPLIDKQVAGPQENLPTSAKENKGRNSYYFLPLILGLLGLAFQYRNDRQNFLVTGLLFFLMSFALVAYLNEVPNTPRERDYVYVGSFYVFCIWIGFGALFLFSQFQKLMKEKLAITTTLAVCLLASPMLLLSQNYDDHDRSGRYSARDLARNYLESCKPNAILFTHADNDTYPLWYRQEVEGIRRDVRVVVMPYLSAEWYIGQLQRKIYENEPLKMTVPLEKYQTGQLDYVYVVPKIETEQHMTDVLEFVASDSSKTKLTVENGEQISYIPVNKIRLQFPDQEPIHFELNKRAINKGDLAFYDIISSNQGKRPICFTTWVDPDEHGLKNNLIYDGLVYRLTDQKTDSSSILDIGKIETENLYTNLMQKCNWDNLADPSINFDWHHRRMFATMQIRNAFYRLANQLTEEKQPEKATEVLKKAEQVMSLKNWPVDYQSILLASLYERNGQKQLGEVRFQNLAKSLEEGLKYYSSFPSNQKESVLDEASFQLSLYNELIKQAADTLPESELKSMKEKLMVFAGKLE